MCPENQGQPKHGRFIGLHALRALVGELVPQYDVLVVFDASARSMMRMSNEELRSQLHGARVHVVATGQRADETLLDAAAGETAYVISNDRFRDFPDKAVVQRKRLLRHEILNQEIHVHELGVRAQLRAAA